MSALWKLREKAGKTRGEVARVLSVTESAVVNYEYGFRTINVHQIIPLAELFGVSERAVINAAINKGEGNG